jgi:hypothetical protein
MEMDPGQDCRWLFTLAPADEPATIAGRPVPADAS